MYSEDNLRSAVNAGVLTDEVMAAFKHHVAQTRSHVAKDEERVRLVTGLNDIFVVIACVLLLLAVGGIGFSIEPWISPVAVAVTAWALAEFFTRKRHLAFPSIVLMLAFVGGVLSTSAVTAFNNFDHWEPDTKALLILMLSAFFGVIAAYFHWSRFNVSMTIAVGSALLLGLISALLFSLFPQIQGHSNIVFILVGLSLFIYAMWWDIRDRNRLSYRSDVAFWLHLFAAPLIVHPIFTAIGIFGSHISVAQSSLVIGLYVVVALISLAIDRRALMISALTYVLYAFTTLLKQYDFISLNFAITALIIGFALLMLAAFWHKCRNFILEFLPINLQNKLSPARVSF